jgi:hypothetical protein
VVLIKNKGEKVAKQQTQAFDMEAAAGEEKIVKPADLKEINRLADEMKTIELELDMLEAKLKTRSARLFEIQTKHLPEMMQTAGVESFKTLDGRIIEVKDFIQVSIPSESAIADAEGPDKEALTKRREECFAWLRTNQADALIKNKLTVEFGKGQDADAVRTLQKLNNSGYPATLIASVHPSTLKSFVREQLQKGVKFPAEAFALFTGKKAEVKQAKKKDQ